MKKAQPEKYYEAWITYNIIMELKRIGKTVYPYSISQREDIYVCLEKEQITSVGRVIMGCTLR